MTPSDMKFYLSKIESAFDKSKRNLPVPFFFKYPISVKFQTLLYKLFCFIYLNSVFFIFNCLYLLVPHIL